MVGCKVTQLVPNEMVGIVAGASNGGREVKLPLAIWLRTEHSPIRALTFMVEFTNLPTFVSTHLVRHKIGVEHFVESNREDLQVKYKKPRLDANRNTPVNHRMIINAQALISMAMKRRCTSTHPHTRVAVNLMVKALSAVNEDVADAMQVQCIYRNGLCQEVKCCNYNRSEHFKKALTKYTNKFFPNANLGFSIYTNDNPRGKRDTTVDGINAVV